MSTNESSYTKKMRWMTALKDGEKMSVFLGSWGDALTEEDKLTKHHRRWFGYLERRPLDGPIRKNPGTRGHKEGYVFLCQQRSLPLQELNEKKKDHTNLGKTLLL